MAFDQPTSAKDQLGSLSDLQQQIEELPRQIEELALALAEAVGKKLDQLKAESKRFDELEEAMQDLAEQATTPATVTKSLAEKERDRYGLDHDLAGILEPSKEDVVAAELAKSLSAPSREELRKAYEDQGLDPNLAGVAGPSNTRLSNSQKRRLLGAGPPPGRLPS